MFTSATLRRHVLITCDSNIQATFEAIDSVGCNSSCWGIIRTLNGTAPNTSISTNPGPNYKLLTNTVYRGTDCSGAELSVSTTELEEWCGMWAGHCMNGSSIGPTFDDISFKIPNGFPIGFTIPPVCADSVKRARSTTITPSTVTVNRNEHKSNKQGIETTVILVSVLSGMAILTVMVYFIVLSMQSYQPLSNDNIS